MLASSSFGACVNLLFHIMDQLNYYTFWCEKALFYQAHMGKHTWKP